MNQLRWSDEYGHAAKDRNLGRLALMVIPLALALGGMSWLSFYMGTRQAVRQVNQEHRAAVSVGAALGYKRLVTYTLASEHGASLRGAGWRLIGEVGGGSWSRKSRPRVDTHPLERKLRWEA